MPHADIEQVREFLSRAARRVTALLVLQGMAAGLAVALAITIVGWIIHRHLVRLGIDSLGLATVGAGIGFARGAMRRNRIAAIVERRAPEYQNLLVTAAELMTSGLRTNSYVAELVFDDAARISARLRARGAPAVAKHGGLGDARHRRDRAFRGNPAREQHTG